MGFSDAAKAVMSSMWAVKGAMWAVTSSMWAITASILDAQTLFGLLHPLTLTLTIKKILNVGPETLTLLQ